MRREAADTIRSRKGIPAHDIQRLFAIPGDGARKPLILEHLLQEGTHFVVIIDHAYSSEDVVRFLRLLLRKLKGKLPVSL